VYLGLCPKSLVRENVDPIQNINQNGIHTNKMRWEWIDWGDST